MSASLKETRTKFFVVILCVFFSFWARAQSLLTTNGTQIVNEQGEEVLLRGMGLGGWMVQEGYMLQTAGFANPQHKIKSFIEDLIGETETEEFYSKWLANYMTKEDVEQLKEWGFNSVRLPMHYNLYTLPIEEEPIPGENTWLEKGFELTDSLISWCAAYDMYVILDMHATPGGQGYDEGISDYDASKPSLWESPANQEKLASLWKQLAIRYKNEKWVAGYDLINEPNWNLPGGTLLREVYERITDSIRTVDQEHILFIEGNWFANDFTGLTPPWDEEIVYSPHKYWSINDQASIQWVLDIRDAHNVPLYLGESGENSNQWFRDAIALLEEHNIGWAWWPLKKVEAIAGPLSVSKTEGYQAILDYGNGSGPKPSAAEASDALFALVEDYKLQHCTVEAGVIDAMFRQVQEEGSIPFIDHYIPGRIYAVHYDYGPNGVAYKDQDVATYHVSTGTYTAWNNGWSYRNDGVDIEPTEDVQNDVGYNVGWTSKDEWLKYSMTDLEEGRYSINVRTAAGSEGGRFYFSADGAIISNTPFVPFSGGYQNWQTTAVHNIPIYEDTDHIAFHIDGAGYNVGWFEFNKTGEISDVETQFVSGTVDSNTVVSFNTNKYLSFATNTLKKEDFTVYINDVAFSVSEANFTQGEVRFIDLTINEEIIYSDKVQLSYTGNTIVSTDDDPLEAFDKKDIKNNLPSFFTIPTRIQAEEYIYHEGIQLENTTDVGGGENIGYLDVGDFCDYDVYIPTGGSYRIKFRNASDGGSGGLELILIDEENEETKIEEVQFTSTDGWQNWTTTESYAILPSGRYTMRLRITQPLFNLNWMDFDFLSTTEENEVSSIELYPNPVGPYLFLGSSPKKSFKKVEIINTNGQLVYSETSPGHSIAVQQLVSGYYVLKITDESGSIWTQSFVKK